MRVERAASVVDHERLADFGTQHMIIVARMNGGVKMVSVPADIFHNIDLAIVGPVIAALRQGPDRTYGAASNDCLVSYIVCNEIFISKRIIQ